MNDNHFDEIELARLGIERNGIEFLWGGERYTNPRDAVAAAKRPRKN